MAQIVGFKSSDFDNDKFQNVFSKNSGETITTQDIKNGWKEVKKILTDDIYEGIKKSQYYIKDTSEFK